MQSLPSSVDTGGTVIQHLQTLFPYHHQYELQYLVEKASRRGLKGSDEVIEFCTALIVEGPPPGAAVGTTTVPLSSTMSDIHKEVLTHLQAIFPQMSEDRLRAAVLSPMNNQAPVSVPILTQRCINYLLQDPAYGEEEDVELNFEEEVPGQVLTETQDVCITGSEKPDIVVLEDETSNDGQVPVTGLTLETADIHLSGEESILIDSQSSDSQSSSDSNYLEKYSNDCQLVSFTLPNSDSHTQLPSHKSDPDLLEINPSNILPSVVVETSVPHPNKGLNLEPISTPDKTIAVSSSTSIATAATAGKLSPIKPAKLGFLHKSNTTASREVKTVDTSNSNFLVPRTSSDTRQQEITTSTPSKLPLTEGLNQTASSTVPVHSRNVEDLSSGLVTAPADQQGALKSSHKNQQSVENRRDWNMINFSDSDSESDISSDSEILKSFNTEPCAGVAKNVSALLSRNLSENSNAKRMVLPKTSSAATTTSGMEIQHPSVSGTQNKLQSQNFAQLPSGFNRPPTRPDLSVNKGFLKLSKPFGVRPKSVLSPSKFNPEQLPIPNLYLPPAVAPRLAWTPDARKPAETTTMNPGFVEGNIPGLTGGTEKPSVTIRSKHKITYNPSVTLRPGEHNVFGWPGGQPSWLQRTVDHLAGDATFGDVSRLSMNKRNEEATDDVIHLGTDINVGDLPHVAGVNCATGLNGIPGVNSATSMNGAPGVNRAPGVSPAPGINNVPGVGHAFGVNNPPGVGHAPGVNSPPGVGHAPGVNSAPGVGHAFGVNSPPGVGHAPGVNSAPGVSRAPGVNSAPGVGHAPGLIPADGVNVAPAVTPPAVVQSLEERMKEDVLQVFPDVCPDHLNTLCNRYQTSGQMAVTIICSQLLDTPLYPKKQAVIPTPVNVVEQPSGEYRTFDCSPMKDDDYNAHSFHLLMQAFPWLSANDIRSVTKVFNFRYAPTYRALNSIWNQGKEVIKKCNLISIKGLTYKAEFKKDDVLTTINIKLLRNKRPINMKSKTSIPPTLQKEIKFIKEFLGKEAEEEDHQLAKEMNEKEYEAAGDSIECGCCYNECPFEDMVQCSEGHLFCETCLQHYTRESVFGQGKTDLKCMTDLCDATFPKSQLQKAVPSEILSRYEERVCEESLNIADLGDMVKCPNCEFRALMDPDDKVFRCQKQSCMMETCRYCQVDWKEHFGKRCSEVEKKDETQLRLEYEEKMTKAKVRVCHRCKAHFTKEDGCNKIICSCGATMCYICRAPKINYDHFCRHARDPGCACTQCKQCSLWSSSEEDDNRAIAEIRKEAEEKRKDQGYTETKVIGVPEGPPVKRAKRSEIVEMF